MYKTGMERAKGHFSPNGSFARVACRVFAFIFFLFSDFGRVTRPRANEQVRELL
jgi:hypothetical protein